jgi:polyhydroxyalkanoate synthesis regulator protein
MQMMVPRYLEVSLESFTREQEKLRQQMAQAFGVGVGGASPFGTMEEQVRRNMEMFEKAFSMFTPFARRDASGDKEPEKAATSSEDIDALKRQMDEMQKRIDKISDKS